MLSIFKSDENIEKLKIVNSFESASTLFVTIKGFNRQNKDRLIAIEKKLKQLPYIKKTKLNTSKIEISDYLKKNYYLLSEFHPIPIDNEHIKDRVIALKNGLLNSFIYQPIDKNDPFGLFKFNLLDKSNMTKDGFLALGEYGYLLTAKLDAKATNMKETQRIESQLSSMFKEDKEVLLFSTLFFTAQNSKIIKNSVHTILYISFALLVLLFFVTLRDYKILLANSITLASSIFVALAFSTYIFQEVSIFTLAFGSAISSISVDYLFHNYFHGQYQKKGINSSILVAFLTTLLGFVLLEFVAFPLISQLSVFAMISLSFSYFQFTFIYPHFGFIPKENRLNLKWLIDIPKLLPINTIFIFSLVAILYASFNIEFDYNLRNLDHNNIELQQKQKIIEENLPQKTTLLIEGSTPNELIEKANEIAYIGAISNLALTQKEFAKRYKNIDKYDFKKLKTLLEANAKLLKFKEGYFSNAYTFIEHIPSSYHVDLESLKEMGYEVIEREGRFYTLATVDKERIDEKNIDEKSIDKKNIDSDKLREGVYIINGLELIKKSTQTMFESLLFYLFITFFAIVLIIFIWVKEKIILALNFIIFPIAIILLYLSVVTINIMHLFSIIIIIVAGIDYGIYMSKEHSNKRQSEATTEATATMEAIFYSLFTSFSGFGILILSSIGAIHSIGVVITIGILSILFLVLFLKNS
jgi:predicted exporter